MARIEAQTVKLYPELCAASLKAGIDKELALWYELRAIDTDGSGRLDIDAVLARLVPMAYSKATLYRILRSGVGHFWSMYTVAKPFTHYKVQIVGILNVARFVGVSHISRPREVCLASFIGRKAKRAQLYSSFHKPAGCVKTKPISRASLELATGVSRRSQLRYDKVAGTKKVANFGFQEDGKGGVSPILEFLKGKKRQYLTVRRLGNIYHSQAVFAASGMAKRVNNQLRERSLEDEGVLPQRFFLSAKSLIKSKHRHTEAFLLAPPGKRLIRGRLEWCLA